MFQGVAINLMIYILTLFYSLLPVLFVVVITGWLFGMFGRVVYSVTLGTKGK